MDGWADLFYVRCFQTRFRKIFIGTTGNRLEETRHSRLLFTTVFSITSDKGGQSMEAAKRRVWPVNEKETFSYLLNYQRIVFRKDGDKFSLLSNSREEVEFPANSDEDAENQALSLLKSSEGEWTDQITVVSEAYVRRQSYRVVYFIN